MTIEEVFHELKKECWSFESWSEHPPSGDIFYVVKLTCGVEARGRMQAEGKTFEEALRKAHKAAIDKWDRI